MSLVITLGAFAAPAFMARPDKLPSVALGSPVLLYAERGLVLFAIALFLLVTLWRAWHGELPVALSQSGAQWAETAAITATTIDAIQSQIRDLRRRMTTVAARLEDVVKSMDKPNEGRAGNAGVDS